MYNLGRFAALIIATTAFSVGASAKSDGPHFVVKVYVASGDPDFAIGNGETVLHKSKVVCPKDVKSCTLVLSAMDQVCNPDDVAGLNVFTVLVSVDSVNVGEGAGGGTGDNPCDARGWMGNVAVGPGTHQVVLSTDVTDGENAWQHNWSVNYTVTTP
jgi:hypothetical protein